MKEHPILFSAPMVLAILAGKKTQTRRIVTVPWKGSKRALPYEPWWVGEDGKLLAMDEAGDYHEASSIMAPYGVPGDKLWVRETWAPYSEQIAEMGERWSLEEARRDVPWASILYKATDTVLHHREVAQIKRWRPSIFLPRRASRITLEVVNVRVERLHAITEEDAKAEGVDACTRIDLTGFLPKSYRNGFAAKWDEINGKRSPWSANAWVWRVEFRRVDAKEKTA